MSKGGSGTPSGGGAVAPGSHPQPIQTPQPPMAPVSSPSLQADKQANQQRMSAKYGWPGV